MSVHLDRGYDSGVTRERLWRRELVAEISKQGRPAPIAATKRWVVERTTSWSNAHKRLVWCTERVGSVIEFWLAFFVAMLLAIAGTFGTTAFLNADDAHAATNCTRIL
jgi:hypothetical protein